MQKFAIIVLPYLLTVSLMIYYQVYIIHNADMAGWWQLGLLIHCLFIGMVALLYIWIDSRGQVRNTKPTKRENLGWTWVFSLFSILPLIISWAINYFNPIDWLAVNEGKISLTPLDLFPNLSYHNKIS